VLDYLLLDGFLIDSKAKRKPLLQFDFKALYGLRTGDINYLADLVGAKKVYIKSSKAKPDNPRMQMMTLPIVGARLRLVRGMQNELVCHY